MQNAVPSTNKHVRRIIVEPVTGGKVRVFANAYMDAYDTSSHNAVAIVAAEGARKDVKAIARKVRFELQVLSVQGVTVAADATVELDRLAA